MRNRRRSAGWLLAVTAALGLLGPALAAAASCCPVGGEAAGAPQPCHELALTACCGAPAAAVPSGELSSPPAPALVAPPLRLGPELAAPLRPALPRSTAGGVAVLATVVLRL
jgi:hypothetical protein